MLLRASTGVFEKWDKPNTPGCALGVYKDGRIIYKRGYGMADLNNDVPITPGTVFHVASMSKRFTAASMVLLAQQGKLSLRKYLPELPDFGERIAIRHLIHHTSGLLDQWELLELESLKLGHGGDQRVAEFLGLNPHTAARGRQQLLAQDFEVNRIRKQGAGRKPVEKKLPT
jgi:CubicO group peptidase (beta-lactamase class C family)